MAVDPVSFFFFFLGPQKYNEKDNEKNNYNNKDKFDSRSTFSFLFRFSPDGGEEEI